jgi:DNA replication and repair protein RecF
LELLDVWDKHISDYGGYLSALRAGYVRLLGSHAKEVYAGISGGKEALSLAYRPGLSRGRIPLTWRLPHDPCGATSPAAPGGHPRRLHRGGAPPDDLEVLIDGLPARSFGSQGQQRRRDPRPEAGECEILR